MTRTLLVISIDDENEYLADENGFLLVFDNLDEIASFAMENGIDLDDITVSEMTFEE